MYRPVHFALDARSAQHDLIDANPLGLLISHSAEGLLANPLPFILDRDIGPHGRLRTHLARANSHWQHLQGEILVVFTGLDHYVTPSWYATKRETGKVVPTWNYETVHAYGAATIHEDAEWLGQQIRDLTHRHESPRADSWAVDDAPAPFIAQQMRAIVGVEILLTRIEGKAKLSQNRNPIDREGVRVGLAAESDPAAQAMAKRMGEMNEP